MRGNSRKKKQHCSPNHRAHAPATQQLQDKEREKKILPPTLRMLYSFNSCLGTKRGIEKTNPLRYEEKRLPRPGFEPGGLRLGRSTRYFVPLPINSNFATDSRSMRVCSIARKSPDVVVNDSDIRACCACIAGTQIHLNSPLLPPSFGKGLTPTGERSCTLIDAFCETQEQC